MFLVNLNFHELNIHEMDRKILQTNRTRPYIFNLFQNVHFSNIIRWLLCNTTYIERCPGTRDFKTYYRLLI